ATGTRGEPRGARKQPGFDCSQSHLMSTERAVEVEPCVQRCAEATTELEAYPHQRRGWGSHEVARSSAQRETDDGTRGRGWGRSELGGGRGGCGFFGRRYRRVAGRCARRLVGSRIRCGF